MLVDAELSILLEQYLSCSVLSSKDLFEGDILFKSMILPSIRIVRRVFPIFTRGKKCTSGKVTNWSFTHYSKRLPSSDHKKKIPERRPAKQSSTVGWHFRVGWWSRSFVLLKGRDYKRLPWHWLEHGVRTRPNCWTRPRGPMYWLAGATSWFINLEKVEKTGSPRKYSILSAYGGDIH